MGHVKIPTDSIKDFTYVEFFNSTTQKDEPLQTRLVEGGNFTSFPGDVSTVTAEITTAKLLFNITISTKGEPFLFCDIKKFYLFTPIDRYEYIQSFLKLLQEEIIAQYGLMRIEHNVYIYADWYTTYQDIANN